MRKRRKLPPDTRPKWNDPMLLGPNGWNPVFLSRNYQSSYRVYDSLPKAERDRAKYSIDGNFPGNPLPRIQTHHR